MTDRAEQVRSTAQRTAQARYAAFLSYARDEEPLARVLQAALQRFAKPWRQLRARQIYRDRTSLTGTPLWPGLAAALNQSGHLIIIASPAAAQRPWVDREVEHWCSTRGTQNIVIVLAGGDIAWNSDKSDFERATTTALPPSLIGRFKDEPRYLDLRSLSGTLEAAGRDPVFRDVVADIVATLDDRPKDDLIGEDVAQRRKTRRLARGAVVAMGFLTAVAITGAVFAFLAQRTAVEQRSAAQEQARLASSRLLAVRSKEASARDPVAAVRSALTALAISPTAEAQAAVAESLRSARHVLGTLVHPEGPITSIASSRDGGLLAAASRQGGVALWATKPEGMGRARAPLRVLEGGRDLRQLAFSSDGQMLAGIDSDGSIVLWNAASGTLLGDRRATSPAEPSADRFVALGFNRSGRQLVAAMASQSAGGTVCQQMVAVMSVPSLETEQDLSARVCPVVSAVVGVNGEIRILATSGARETWGGSGGRRRLLGRRPEITTIIGPPVAVSQSPVTRRLAYLLPRREFNVFVDTPTNNPRATCCFRGEEESRSPIRAPSGLAFSANGRFVGAAGEGRLVRWRIGALQDPVVAEPVSDGGAGLVVSSNGRWLATAQDDTVTLWRIVAQDPLLHVLAPISREGVGGASAGLRPTPVASPTGRFLAWNRRPTSDNRADGLMLLDRHGKDPPRLLGRPRDGLSFLPDETGLVGSDGRGFSLIDGAPLMVRPSVDERVVTSEAVAPDGAFGFLRPGLLTLVQRGADRVTLELPDDLETIVALGEGRPRFAVLCGETGQPQVWDTAGRLVGRLPLDCTYGLDEVAFAHGGRLISTRDTSLNSNEQRLELWDAMTAQSTGFTATGVEPARLSSDGTQIATVSPVPIETQSGRGSWRIEVYRRSDGALAAAFPITLGENDEPALLWTPGPQGELAVFGGGGVAVLPASSAALRRQACALAGRGLDGDEMRAVLPERGPSDAC